MDESQQHALNRKRERSSSEGDSSSTTSNFGLWMSTKLSRRDIFRNVDETPRYTSSTSLDQGSDGNAGNSTTKPLNDDRSSSSHTSSSCISSDTETKSDHEESGLTGSSSSLTNADRDTDTEPNSSFSTEYGSNSEGMSDDEAQDGYQDNQCPITVTVKGQPQRCPNDGIRELRTIRVCCMNTPVSVTQHQGTVQLHSSACPADSTPDLNNLLVCAACRTHDFNILHKKQLIDTPRNPHLERKKCSLCKCVFWFYGVSNGVKCDKHGGDHISMACIGAMQIDLELVAENASLLSDITMCIECCECITHTTNRNVALPSTRRILMDILGDSMAYTDHHGDNPRDNILIPNGVLKLGKTHGLHMNNGNLSVIDAEMAYKSLCSVRLGMLLASRDDSRAKLRMCHSPLGNNPNLWEAAGIDYRRAFQDMEVPESLLNHPKSSIDMKKAAISSVQSVMESSSVGKFIAFVDNDAWHRISMLQLGLSWVREGKKLISWPYQLLMDVCRRVSGRMATVFWLNKLGLLQKTWDAESISSLRSRKDTSSGDQLKKHLCEFLSHYSGNDNYTIALHFDNVDMAASNLRGNIYDKSTKQAHGVIGFIAAILKSTITSSNEAATMLTGLDKKLSTPLPPAEFLHAAFSESLPDRDGDDDATDLALPSMTFPPNSHGNIVKMLTMYADLLDNACDELGYECSDLWLAVADGLIHRDYVGERRRLLLEEPDVSDGFFRMLLVPGLFHISSHTMKAIINIGGPFGLYPIAHLLGVLSGARLDAMEVHSNNRLLCASILEALLLAFKEAYDGVIDDDGFNDWVHSTDLRLALWSALDLLVDWLALEVFIRTGQLKDTAAVEKLMRNIMIILLADGHSKSATCVADFLGAIKNCSHYPALKKLFNDSRTGLSAWYAPTSDTMLALDELTEFKIKVFKAFYSGPVDIKSICQAIDKLFSDMNSDSGRRLLEVLEIAHRNRRGAHRHGNDSAIDSIQVAVNVLVPGLRCADSSELLFSDKSARLLHNKRMVIVLEKLKHEGSAAERGRSLEEASTNFHDTFSRFTSGNIDSIAGQDYTNISGFPLTRRDASGIAKKVFGISRAKQALQDKPKKKKPLIVTVDEQLAGEAVDIDDMRATVANLMSEPYAYYAMLTTNGIDGAPLTQPKKSSVLKPLFDRLGLSFVGGVQARTFLPGQRLKIPSTVIDTGGGTQIHDTTQLFYGGTGKPTLDAIVSKLVSLAYQAMSVGQDVVFVFDAYREVSQWKGWTEDSRDRKRANSTSVIDDCPVESKVDAHLLRVKSNGGYMTAKEVIDMPTVRQSRELRGLLIKSLKKLLMEHPVLIRLLRGKGKSVSMLIDSDPLDEDGHNVYTLDNDGSRYIDELDHDHEEADNGMFVHLFKAIESLSSTCTLISSDTDVAMRLIIAKSLAWRVNDTEYKDVGPTMIWDNRRGTYDMASLLPGVLNVIKKNSLDVTPVVFVVSLVVATMAAGNDFPVGFPSLPPEAFINGYMAECKLLGPLVDDHGQLRGRSRFTVKLESIIMLLKVVISRYQFTKAAFKNVPLEEVIEMDHEKFVLQTARHLHKKVTAAPIQGKKRREPLKYIPPSRNATILAVSRLQTALEYAIAPVVGEKSFNKTDWLASPANGTMSPGFIEIDGQIRVLYTSKDDTHDELFSPAR